MNPNECRNLRATPSDVKHFLTTPAVRFPALVPDAGMLCVSRSVLDFESSLHVRNFVRDLSQRGKPIWTKFPRFVDNRRSGNEVTSFVFLFKSLKKIRGAPCLCRVADFHKVKSGPIQVKGFEGCIEKPYFPLSW